MNSTTIPAAELAELADMQQIDEAMRERARAGLDEAKLRTERERLTTTETDVEASHA